MAKVTKKEMFNKIIVAIEGTDCPNKDTMVEFLEHEIDLLERKSSKTTLTKRQKENIGVVALIHDALFEVARPVTITELMSGNAELCRYTPQKISALLKQMKDRGEVVRVEDKKKAYFSLAETD